ncbi:hypothetical protein [Roseisalinus antarcticus]|nr:hypothetical protein [Roseisalinus antarcticus]
MPREPVSFDTTPLVRLFAELGEMAAEDTVCNTLEQVSLRLHRLEKRCHRQEFDAIPDLAAEIALLADRIGLATVSRVAGHVGDRARVGDLAALAATVGRLSRAVDHSVAGIWDISDA